MRKWKMSKWISSREGELSTIKENRRKKRDLEGKKKDAEKRIIG